MNEWTIYYGDDTTITGKTKKDWDAAPSDNVQVVVLWEKPALNERYWRNVEDRKIWTGVDKYSIKRGWKAKNGKLITNKKYQDIANKAFYGDKP